MKKIFEGNYYLGLDIGTDSIGWSVTDENYKLLKINGKTMWGIRLFDSANTAAERRSFRSARRRGQRKVQRIKLLQELFAKEINKLDPDFFQRLKDSPLLEEDKKVKQSYTLFNGKDYSDVTYHKEYPTVYHLRKALLEENKCFDIRLVYLALHHIIKHRGHFLFEGNDIDNVTSFQNTYDNFSRCLQDEFDINLECNEKAEIEDILKNKKSSKTEKKRKLLKLFSIEKSDVQLNAIISLIVGLKAKLSDIFNDSTLKEIEKSSISFTEGSYEETRMVLEEELQERCNIIDILKSVYDWTILADVLEGGEYNGNAYLSVAKAKIYNKHHEDLRKLKTVIKQYCPEQYKEVFSKVVKDNYCAYVGSMKINGRKQIVKKCTKEDFYKFILKTFNNITEDDRNINVIKSEITNGTFMPMQVTKDNGVIPYQVHKIELIQILNNAACYLTFLKDKDEDGITVKDKIIKLFEFRIPYYIGPINTTHNVNSWMIRKKDGAIRPWNFERKINVDATAEAFIRRMTNKCTYLVNKDVLPKHSLLYSEFMAWNELNNVKIRQEELPVEIKQKIFQELFQKKKRVTGKMLLNYLLAEGYEITMEELSGFDENFKSSLSSYIDFKNEKIFGEKINNYSVQKVVEDIILWITLYGEDKQMLKRVIRNHYSEEIVSEFQIKEICKLKYQGWGRLSREFLQELEGADSSTGEFMSIIQALRTTNDNLMQLLSRKYTYIDAIEVENKKEQNSINEFTYDTLVKDIIASPSIKRAIWQVILITEEIRKITGKEPKKIFLEVARGSEEKKRTTSRKDRLIELYKNCKEEGRDWKEELENTPESNFRSDKLYLYYTQMGKCMYSGERIELSELANTNIYDRDHIYPQSKTKDDSLDNLVLVKKEINAKKSDDVISFEIQSKMNDYWRFLRKSGFISEEKYNRLTRKTPLTDEELARFINRQLVETRQSSKIVATLLNRMYKSSEIVYVKAKVVSDFRQDNLNMIKLRDVNDYHHAKDAYLNIVVGNVYHTKFTNNPLKWLKNNQKKNYSLNRMFDYDIFDGDKIVWKRGNNGTVALVKKIMRKNNILFTRYAMCNKGGLFDQQIVSKEENATVPIKKGMDVKKYGGYKTITPAYFMLVESLDKKGNKLRTIETVPLYLIKQFENNPDMLLAYCRKKYNLINPVIIIPKIKKNSYLIIDGFPMHLRGSNGRHLSLLGAVQLCIDEDSEAYLKKIMKYLQRNIDRKDKKSNLTINKYDYITKEENIKTYDLLLRKQKDTIYKNRPASQVSTLEKGRDKFIGLSLEEQCILIGELLHLLQCKPLQYANLSLIGGSSYAGKIQVNKKISTCTSAKLIHKSSTGIFEQEIDLLTV